VLAKTERDALMVQLHEQQPRYGWLGNKGYSAPEHTAALREHGPCELHRRSWSLPLTEGYVADELDLEVDGGTVLRWEEA
jgi:ribonuclease HII